MRRLAAGEVSRPGQGLRTHSFEQSDILRGDNNSSSRLRIHATAETLPARCRLSAGMAGWSRWATRLPVAVEVPGTVADATGDIACACARMARSGIWLRRAGGVDILDSHVVTRVSRLACCHGGSR